MSYFAKFRTIYVSYNFEVNRSLNPKLNDTSKRFHTHFPRGDKVLAVTSVYLFEKNPFLIHVRWAKKYLNTYTTFDRYERLIEKSNVRYAELRPVRF